MFIDIDYDKRKKGYKINLAKPNQQTIASISEAYGANYSIKLGNINEVTFNVPYFIDKLDERVKNENIELIKEKMYTKISYNNNDEWMVIDTIEDVGSGDEKYMTVTAFTNVYETSNRKINELNLEVVNPEEYYNAVLNDVAWSIGTIDPLFKDIYRSVELSNVTVLEAIITGAETFGAVLDFDTENKKINLMDMDSRAKYRGLNINYSNFLQSINRKRSVDEMTTRLYVYGSEDLSIENVNPTGMRYLEDFTYFLYPFERDENKNVIKSSHYMSDELAHAILDKNELSKEYQPQIKSMQEEIDEETIEYINETTLLNELRFDEMSVSGLLDIAKATEDNDLILQRQSELAEIKTKISIKELTVDHISATIEDLERQITQLQSQISVTSFSKELYDELSMYIIESEFRDDRYIDEEELYRDALKKFDESKSPSVVIEASIDNIIDSLEEDYYSDKVVLGDIARVTDKEMSVEMKSLIVELSFDLDNNTCDVTIANGDIEKDGYDRILSVLYDTQSTTTMLENNKYKWDTVTDVKTEVDLMRDGEIDATRNRIKAGFRESVTIEDRGIILSNPDFPDEIVIMQAGVIALSTDGGENWSTSITPRGVVAETIIGRLVASNNLIVTNDSGSFRIDGEGLTVDMDSIKIMSGEGDTPENIVDSWNEMLITMDEFADDGKLNEYEKNQIARQWNSIAIAHSSMVDAIQNAYGPETPENPYPAEYEIYMESYERLRGYLNDEIQSDGHTILDPLHRGETTDIDSDKYNRLVSDYEVNKDRFQTVIPLEFSQTFIEQTRKEISLNYVQNGEVATKLNLSEEGVRIDGRLLEVNSETHFNDDLVMNAGLIRSADGAINIDLNSGVINLSRPLTINAFPVATEEFVEESLSDAVKDIDVEYGITSNKNTPPSDWNTTPPAWEDGKYIWSRTITVYKNGNTEITEPVNITGATGSSGGAGLAGRSVKNIQEQYYLSTSPLDLENGSWRDTPPEWEADKYIWTRSVITYENPSGQDRTDPVSVSGQQGPKGETGSDGKDAPLVKLSGKTQIIKQDNTGRLTPASNFTVTGSSVNTTINSWRYSTDGGNFISSPPVGVARSGATITVNPTLVEFNTLTIRASDGKVSDDFTIARAVDGATGEDAYTVILTNESHTFAGNIFSAVPSSTTADIIAYKGDVRVPVKVDSITGTPEGMNTGISSNGTINTRVTFTVDEKLVEESGTVKLNLVLSGNFITKEFSFAVAYKGERGEKGERGATGERGPKGSEGTGISSVTEHYLISNQSTGVTYSTSGWGTSIPTMTSELRFLWNYEEIHFTDGTSEPTLPVVVGVYGQQGPKGSEGEDGRSIENIEERYLATSSGSGVTRSTDGWKEEMQVTTPTKKYLWNYEIITWSKAPFKTYVEPIIIGIHGDKGETGERGPRGLEGQQGPEGKQGIQGPEGKDGISTYTHIAYSTSKTGANFEHSTFDDATYIGMYVSNESDSSDNPADYEWTLIKGKDGSQGLRGPEGKDGRTPYFHTAWANNSTGTSEFSTTVSTNKLYIGTATTFEKADPTEPSAYSWTKIKGDKGDKGDEGTGVSDVSVTYQNHSNGTTAPKGNWGNSPNPVKGTYLWARTITSYTDGEEITTYNVSYNATDGQRGPQGPQGGTGTDGTGVSGTEVRYSQSASGTIVPTSGWQTTPHSPIQGEYNWTRTIVSYTDGTKSTSYSTSYNAKDGQKGDKGDEGKGIKSQVVTYQNHSNGTTAPTGSWVSSPSPVKGQYLWTRTVTQYTEGNPITTYAVAYNAKDGQKGATGGKGDEGTGISSTVIRYFQSTSGTTTPTGSGATTPPTPIQGQYNWTKTVITYTDGTSSTAWSTSYNAKDGQKGDKGDKGATGSTGPKGDAGKGIKAQTVTYQNHTNGTTAPTGTWTNSPSPVKGRYLWTRTVTTYTEGNPVTTYAVAYNATDGQNGSEGTGIKSTQVRYQQSTSGSTTPTGTWQTSIPTPTKGRYLWTRTIITYTDGTTSTAYSTSYYATDGQKGDKGDTGDRGPQGPQGPQGISITKVDVEYAQNSSSTSAPTSGWSTNAPAWKNGQYIWSRTKTTYSSGNPTYSKPACITGQKGSVGGVGNDGKGISSIVEQYYLSDSKETRTGGSWTTTVPKWEQGKYMWTRSQINWINPTGTTYTDPIVDSAWEAVQEGTKGIGLADKTEILSGTEIFTDEADDSVVHVEFDGKSYQHAGSGKNLWNDDAAYIGRGSVNRIPNGFRMGPDSHLRILLNVNVGSNYSISAKTNPEDGQWRLRVRDINSVLLGSSARKEGYKAINDKTIFEIYTPSSAGTIDFTNIQIEEGSTATEYEPPAPTPDYPIEIHSLNDFEVVSSVGKGNLQLDSTNFETGWVNRNRENPVNITVTKIDDVYSRVSAIRDNSDSHRRMSYTLDQEKIEVGEKVTVSFDIKNNTNYDFTLNIHGLVDAETNERIYSRVPKNSHKKIISSGIRSTGYTRTFFEIYFEADFISTNFNFDIGNLMVQKGNKATDWTPAPEDIKENDNHPLIDKISLSLSEPLRSVGNIHDRLFRDDSDDGLWKIERNVGEYVVTGNEGWTDEYISSNGLILSAGALNGIEAQSGRPIISTNSSEVIITNNRGSGLGFRYAYDAFNVNSIGEFINSIKQHYNENPIVVYYTLKNPTIETIDQELQDKLNNLRSFQDFNYVYTVIDDKTDIISENLKPTLHATFKGGGWYDRWKTEDELEKHQRELANKTDVDVTNKINEDLAGMVVKTENDKELGEITTKLNDYLSLLDQTRDSIFGVVDDDGNPIQEGVTAEVEKLLDRAVAVEREMGTLRDTWNFEVTQITMAEEGMFVGTQDSNMGILIAPDRKVDGKEIPAGIYFQDAGETIAFISGQMMQINRGIFVDSAQIGEHQIETISGGHTIFRWIPK